MEVAQTAQSSRSTAVQSATRSRQLSPRFLTSLSLLYATIIITVWLFYDDSLVNTLLKSSDQNSRNWLAWSVWHSHEETSPPLLLASLFQHADWEHVIGNMFALWLAGRRVFVSVTADPNSARRTTNSANKPWDGWTHPMAFIWIYYGSHIYSVIGCRLLSYWLDQQWYGILQHRRQGWSTWLHPMADIWSTLTHTSQIAKLRWWQWAPTIGASGAVYGVIGAQVYTGLISTIHPGSMDLLTCMYWCVQILTAIRGTPFTLHHFSWNSWWLSDSDPFHGDADDDGRIDHASHLFGFMGGFILAYLWEIQRFFSLYHHAASCP